MYKKVLKELFSTAIYLLIVLALTFLLIKYVGQRTVVDGTSMYSTLDNGDNLWVDKFTYHFDDPERFDIIVFPPYEEEKKTFYIKRVIGLPGETVQITPEGQILINGEVLEENYGYETILENHIGRAETEILLGEDEYFVMGDNRNNSIDSRFDVVGNISRDQIIGKAVFRMYPFSSFGSIK